MLRLRAALLSCALLLLAAPACGRADSDEWLPFAPSPLERTEVGAARVGDGIYVVGGFVLGPSVTKRVLRYDIGDDEWSEVAQMPVAVHHPGVTSYRGRLYVHGGFKGTASLANPTAALQRYNPETGKWKRLAPSGKKRAAHTIEAMNGKLYAVGGTRPGEPSTASMSIYNVAAGDWHRGPDMSVARNHLTGVALDGRVFAIGGRAGSQNLDAVERYKPGAGWKQLPDLQVARSGVASGTAHGKIIVFGGEELAEGDSTIEEVEAYDRIAKQWSFLPSMLTPRHGLGGASYQGTVYALEGGPSPGFAFSDAVEHLDIPE